MMLFIPRGTIATEAINFQVNNKFPKELDAIWQMAFDRSDKLRDEGVDYEVRREELLHYFSNTLCKLITKCVVKYTGLFIAKHTISNKAIIEDAFEFYMYSYTKASVNGKNRHKAIVGKKITNRDDLTDAFDTISESLDKKTGKLNMYSANDIVVELGISLNIFFLKDLIDNPIEITPQELTSAILHEIGHALSFIEYSRNTTYTGYFGNNILSNIYEYAKEHPKDAAKVASEQIRKKKDHFPNQYKELLSKIDDWLVVATEDEQNDPIRKQLLILVIIAAFSTIYLLMSIIAGAFMSTESIFQDLDAFDNRYSKDTITSKNQTMNERLADEYVSRFQYGKYVNEFLIKVNQIRNMLTSKYPLYTLTPNKAIRQSRSLLLITKTLTIPSRFYTYLRFIKRGSVNTEYEHMLKRLRRNINNLHDVLHQPNIPENVKHSIINDIDEMEQLLTVSSKDFQLNAFEEIFQMIMNTVPNTISGIVSLFNTNNQRRKYEQLFEYADSMLSNKAAYYALKIKSIMQ